MSGVQQLEAAIEKLDRLRAERAYEEFRGWLVEPTPGDTGRLTHPDDAGVSPVTNDELIVVLHRTIDAQLAVLRAAQIEHGDVMTSIERPYWDAALALADAVLGERRSGA